MFDAVNHPAHYTSHPSGIECIDITRDMTFSAGNAFKYVYRAQAKGGRQDIEKARWYLLDALAHRDFVILARKVPDWVKLIEAVHEFEPDKLRKPFYASIGKRDLNAALAYVNMMLADSYSDPMGH
jgi:hypothetical protein